MFSWRPHVHISYLSPSSTLLLYFYLLPLILMLLILLFHVLSLLLLFMLLIPTLLLLMLVILTATVLVLMLKLLYDEELDNACVSLAWSLCRLSKLATVFPELPPFARAFIYFACLKISHNIITRVVAVCSRLREMLQFAMELRLPFAYELRFNARRCCRLRGSYYRVPRSLCRPTRS